ncbi:hypothetical protein DH2020_044488 [Rehmannia glutinosa]|uniref:Mini-chromosome maintenance complex-binding protein n=1 Tax=Rehmannia glutinosa TaxID=99300 RepID=A0ABR0UHK2_REHGL
MVGLPYDCLANPLGAVRLTFEKAVGSGSDPAALDGKDWGAADLFRQFLFDDGGLSQVNDFPDVFFSSQLLMRVPLLNPSTIKWVMPNTLVRFRGMIQDMLGNEYYVGAYKDGDKWRTNKFADVSQCPVDASSDMRIWERRLLYCVPVPGQNSWVEPSHEAMNNVYANSISPQREKRQREDDATMTDVDMVEAGHHALEDSPNFKKMKVATEGNSSNSSLVPVDRNSFPCLVKIYDSSEPDMKLNDVFEFVGVFTFDPDLTIGRDDNDELTENFCEDASVSLPPTKVPRLHCVVHRKLGFGDFLRSPQLEVSFTSLNLVHASASSALCACKSRFNCCRKLSLNLTCFNKESASVFGNNLKRAIENLLPFTERLPLTIDYLNTVSLAPKKDYSTNRPHYKVGPLTQQGRKCKNIEKHDGVAKVEYDFTYYKMEMAADVQLLILSEGKSNILPADLILPFHPSLVDSTLGVDEEMLKSWRWYLATMKSLCHSIEPHMQKVVEDDLVAARQADRSLGSQEFSRWLTMGRLMSISFGETCLSMEHWQMVKELERLRKERL